MKQVLEGIPIYLQLGFFVAVNIGTLGFLLDKHIRRHYRQEISLEWQRIDKNSWPKKFLKLHDHLLTSSSSSAGRPRLGRSAALSMLSMFVITIGWILFGLPENNWGNKIENLEFIILIFVVYVIPVNILGDYFSFWETRIVVGRMAESTRKFFLVFYVLFDFVVTTLLFLVCLVLGSAVLIIVAYVAGMRFEGSVLDEIGRTIVEIVLSGAWLFASTDLPEMDAFGVLYLTTLTTSIWIWAYMIGSQLWPVVLIVANMFEVERKPIGYAMTMGGVVLGFLVAAIGGFVDYALPLIKLGLSAMELS